MDPGDERSGPPQAAPTGTTTEPSVPTGTDSARHHRRIRLYHLLVRRPRWSYELDDLCTADEFGEILAELHDLDDGDFWHDTYMDRGILERERAGQVTA